MAENHGLKELESSSNSDHRADEVLLHHIEQQLVQLRIEAAELDRAAGRMASEASDEADLTNEAAQASAQAGELRNVAAMVEQQIAAAATDKRGQKKIASSVLAGMQSTISRALHEGETELAETAHHIQEASETHTVVKAVKAALSEEKKPKIATPASRAPRREPSMARATPAIVIVRAPEPEPTIGERIQHAQRSAMDYVRARAEEAEQAARETWRSVTESSVVQGTISAAQRGGAAVVAFVSHPIDHLSEAASAVSTTVSEAASTVKQTAQRAAASVSDTASSLMASARAKTKAIASALGFGDDAGDAAKLAADKAAAQKAALAKAQAQARTVATPKAKSGMDAALASLGTLLPASLPHLPVMEWDLPSLF